MTAANEREFHERLTREEPVAGSSERGFGLTVAGAGALIAAIKLWHGQSSGWWWSGAAAAFAAVAIGYPGALAPLNRLWMRLGRILNGITTPVLLGLIFFSIVSLTALLMRALGRDPLRLHRDPGAATYWIVREPPGPAPETMKLPF